MIGAENSLIVLGICNDFLGGTAGIFPVIEIARFEILPDPVRTDALVCICILLLFSVCQFELQLFLLVNLLKITAFARLCGFALSVVSHGTLARFRTGLARPDHCLSKESVSTISLQLVLPHGRIMNINVSVKRDTVRLRH